MARKRITKKKMIEKATEAVAKTEEAAKTVAEKTEAAVKAAGENIEEHMNKPEVKEAVSVVSEAVKETVTETAKETKEHVKAAAKAVRTRIADTVVEVNGASVSMAAVEKAVKKDAADKGMKGDITIYLNIAEQTAYYTVHGEGSENQKVHFSNC